MAGDKKYFNAKTGENHGIFGCKYLKFHRMKDPKWTAGDKIIQYHGITKLYERDHTLLTLNTIIKRKNEQAAMKHIKKTLLDGTGYLQIATFGDAQNIKNIFQEHPEIQRAYHPLMIENILEKIDQRTFFKRKALDKLVHRLGALNVSYTTELMKVSELQDRTKFVDPRELCEETEAKSYELELRHCSTRMRTGDAISRVYNEIIRTMLKDSIYYDPVLNALQEDLMEQNLFIQKTITTGIPTSNNVQQLQREFEELDIETNKQLTHCFRILLEHREILSNNTIRIKNVVRRDSDFDVNPNRYDRDTRSMVDLKLHMEEIEKILKQLKNATSCGKPKEIYPRVKQQVQDSKQMKKKLMYREHQRNLQEVETTLAEFHRDDLANDFTPDEIRRIADVTQLQEKISQKKVKHEQLQARQKRVDDINNVVKSSFQYILAVLRNIEGSFTKMSNSQFSEEDWSYLHLPLLNLNTAGKTPENIENVHALLDATKGKVLSLMQIYRKAKEQPVIQPASSEYQNTILKEYNEFNMRSMKDIDRAMRDDFVFDDPNVYSRKQVKAMSASIVEKNSKTED